jgi:hypothetical protein
VAAYLVLRDGYDLLRRRAVGRVLLELGTPVVALGALVSVLGPERALIIWNDQMALLPWGLSRILGITTYLGIPTVLPEAAMALGAILLVAGVVLSIGSRRARTGDTQETHRLGAE